MEEAALPLGAEFGGEKGGDVQNWFVEWVYFCVGILQLVTFWRGVQRLPPDDEPPPLCVQKAHHTPHLCAGIRTRC